MRYERKIDFRYDLMDNQERILDSLKATGSISFNSQSDVMGTGSFQIREEKLQQYAQFYVDMRIRPQILIWDEDGNVSEKYLGIYIMTSPIRSGNNNTVVWNVDCYDKGIILKEDKLQDRLYIPAGSNYVAQVKNVLLSAGINKFSIESSSLTNSADIEFEIGTSKLDVINDLLYAINFYPIHFDGNGFAETSRYIEPMQRSVQLSYMTDHKSIILEGAQQSNDLYNVPNVVVRYVDNPDADPLRSVYINNNPDSIISTVRRGRNIVDVESVDDIADQDTLDSYTKRIAIEKSQACDSVMLRTGLTTGHGFRNCIFVRDDELEISTKYIEYSWNMDLKVGGSMTHHLKRVLQI